MCATDKHPGLDGYPMGFYLKCLEVLKKDKMETFFNFHSNEMFEKYIALNPKKGQRSSDFKSINLIGNFYNLISKALTERLKRVVEKLMDKQQMAFIKGGQIMDVVLIAKGHSLRSSALIMQLGT